RPGKHRPATRTHRRHRSIQGWPRAHRPWTAGPACRPPAGPATAGPEPPRGGPSAGGRRRRTGQGIGGLGAAALALVGQVALLVAVLLEVGLVPAAAGKAEREIGRASCRERG